MNTDGVHTSKATFGNKTPSLSGHGRMPSDDLVLGLPNLSAIQSSVSKMNVRPQRQQSDAAAAAASDAGSSESASKAEGSLSDSTDGASVSSFDAATTPATEQTGFLSTSATYAAPDSAAASTCSLPSLPPSLADLQNPATFSIQPSPKHGRKITKASFFDPSRPALGETTTDQSQDTADPLDKLDPLWSLKLAGKEPRDSEES